MADRYTIRCLTHVIGDDEIKASENPLCTHVMAKPPNADWDMKQ